MRRWLRSPAAVVAGCLTFLLLVGALSEGFRRSRALVARRDSGGRFLAAQTFLGEPFGVPARNLRVWQAEAATCTVEPLRRGGQTLLEVRLRDGATPEMARQELLDIVTRNGLWMTGAGFVLVPLEGGWRVPGFLYGAAVFAALALGLALWPGPWRSRGFLVLKSELALVCLGVAAVESGARGALFTWAFLLGCCALLYAALADQRRRCPVCLRRVAAPLSSGSWSSVLQPAATEFLCDRGHGTLSLPGGGWKSLEDSWRELFDKERT